MISLSIRTYNTLGSPYGKLKGFYISIAVEYMLNQFRESYSFSNFIPLFFLKYYLKVRQVNGRIFNGRPLPLLLKSKNFLVFS